MNTIKEFQGAYRFLSNFYPASIYKDGIFFPTIEHAYQASKSDSLTVRQSIAQLATPGQAKRCGKTIAVREDFFNQRIDIMYFLVELKFKSHPELARLLLATGDSILEEGNKWGDTFWGICNGVGENHLGKILMKVRSNLLLECL